MKILGTTENTEWQKVHLESQRKQNELMDLEIEMKKIELEKRKFELKCLKGI